MGKSALIALSDISIRRGIVDFQNVLFGNVADGIGGPSVHAAERNDSGRGDVQLVPASAAANRHLHGYSRTDIVP